MNYTAWLKWGVIGGLCLCLFTIFIVADGVHFPLAMFFPYITGKNFTFRILIEIVFALYVLLAIREPKYRPRSSLLMWSVGLFVVWMGLATMLSVDPIKSFWSNFERMDGYITLIHMFAFFIITGAVLTAENWWEKFFQISIASSILMGFNGLFQVLGILGFAPSSQSGPRADGTFGNAIYLAVFMLFNIFLTLYLLVRERKSRAAWWIYGIALIIQFATLYATETRGALLGVVGGIVVAAIYVAWFGGTQYKAMRRWSMYVIGAVAVLVVIFFAIRNTDIVKHSNTLSRLASISFTERTTISRFTLWGEAWQGFQAKPIQGWGQENFSYIFNQYYNPTMFDQEQWFDRAHNAFVDWATAGGLPAILLYASFFVLAVWALYKSELPVPEQAILIGAFAAYAFNNFTVFDNLSSYMYFFLLLAFVHSLSRKKLPSMMFMSKPGSDRAVAVAAPIVLIVLVYGVWALNGSGLARAQTLIDAITPYTAIGGQKAPTDNLKSFQDALSMGSLGYQETVEQLFQMSSSQIAPSTTISPDVKQQAFSLTKSAADTLIKQRPHDSRIELFYGLFLDQFGQYKDGLAMLEQAAKDSPGKQQILFQISSTYVAQGDYKSAIAPLKQAFEEAPTFDTARTLYVAVLYYNNQPAEADKLLTERFGTTIVDDAQLIQAYFNTKQYDRLAGIYALRLKTNPSDAQALVGHAVSTYFVNGNKTAAIAELQKAIISNPDLTAQIQSFIDQIRAGTLKP